MCQLMAMCLHPKELSIYQDLNITSLKNIKIIGKGVYANEAAILVFLAELKLNG